MPLAEPLVEEPLVEEPLVEEPHLEPRLVVHPRGEREQQCHGAAEALVAVEVIVHPLDREDHRDPEVGPPKEPLVEPPKEPVEPVGPLEHPCHRGGAQEAKEQPKPFP